MSPPAGCPEHFDDLFPPNPRYPYFSLARRHPFRYAEPTFHWANAWWLAEASLLVYADPPDIAKAFGSHATVKPFQRNGTFCSVASTQHFAMVVFRGTQVPAQVSPADALWDWLTELKLALVGWSGEGAVHEGFRDALDAVWEDWTDKQGRPVQGLKSYLDDLTAGPFSRRALWFAGHSQGGALATLAILRYGRPAGLYTFGAPCVGDEAFARSFEGFVRSAGAPAYRIVHATDIVPRVLERYCRHVGVLRSIQGKCPPVKGVVTDLSDLRRVPFFMALADHAPIYYALYARNAL